MKANSRSSGINRRVLLSAMATLPALSTPFLPASAPAQTAAPGGLLPSWNDGAAKQAILDFVRATIDRSSPSFVFPEDRIATFDQDGTLWVEHPIYSQVVFASTGSRRWRPSIPSGRTNEPFKTVLSGDHEAMAKLPMRDLEEIVVATHAGMTVEAFNADAANWLAKATDPRWDRPYTELVYQPMLEVLRYLRANGFRTYIVTGGGQDFVRVYAEQRLRHPARAGDRLALAERATGTTQDGKPYLTKEPKLLLNNNNAGKAEDINLFIGQRPHAAFGNSTGDRQMLEWTAAGDGARLEMLVLHDDAEREYAYGPAQGLPDTKVGTFTQALMDEAKKNGWTVISMKNDWKRIFAFE